GLAEDFDVERARVEGKDKDADEYEGRAGDRVEHELGGRVLLAPRAPDGDQQEHREQFEFPEEKEEQEIERDEDADDRTGQEHEAGEVGARPNGDTERDEHGGDR